MHFYGLQGQVSRGGVRLNRKHCCVTAHAQLTPGSAARRGCLFYRVAARAARHRRCGHGLGPAACEGQLAARALVVAQRRAKPWNQALARHAGPAAGRADAWRLHPGSRAKPSPCHSYLASHAGRAHGERATWRAHREAQHQGLRWQALLGPVACVKSLWRVHLDAWLLASRARPCGWWSWSRCDALQCGAASRRVGVRAPSRVLVPYGPLRPAGASGPGGGSCAGRGSEQVLAGPNKTCWCLERLC